MNELHAILDAWAEAEKQSISAVLATVVEVKGSAYRRPGARMLMLPDGRHTGSISGGCLEGDVAKKAWWLTEDHHPVLRVYDTTSEDDAVWEFGLGCNGVVKVLLERTDTESSQELLRYLQECRRTRRAGQVSTVIYGDDIGRRLYDFAAVDARECFTETIAPPLPLFVFGAGHDAIPLVAIAKELGWHVTVADGRPAYATPVRFPRADAVRLFGSETPIDRFEIGRESAVVLMSHNYPQDRRLLREILPLHPRYLGILGPRARTNRMLAEIGAEAHAIHAPIGLDIGAETPEAIALSILAEIQATIAGRPGGQLSLRGGPIHKAGDNRQQYRHPLPLRGRESAELEAHERESLLCSLGSA